MWNPDHDLKKVMTSLTWNLNINVNIIGVKRVRNSATCAHSETTKQCMFLFYVFQNPIIKLKNTSIFDCVNILLFRKKYYILNCDSLWPVLIKQEPSLTIEFNGIQVSTADITKILDNQPMDLPFSVAIYSTFTYVTPSQIKHIQNNLIHFYEGTNQTETLHLFLSPQTNSNQFSITCLKNIACNKNDFNKKNVYVNPHLTEGTRKQKSRKNVEQEILNQNFCICEHYETTRLYLPKPTSFHCLGNIYLCN